MILGWFLDRQARNVDGFCLYFAQHLGQGPLQRIRVNSWSLRNVLATLFLSKDPLGLSSHQVYPTFSGVEAHFPIEHLYLSEFHTGLR